MKIMKNRKITGVLFTMAMIIGGSFPALAYPATGAGTMPNDIEIRNGDGSAPAQITLGEAFETAFIEDESIDEWYWVDYGFFRRMPDSPAYGVHEDAVFIMPADGYYQISIEGKGYSGGSDVKTYTELVPAKKGDVVPMVNKEIKLASGGDINSYLYQLGLVTDTGDGGMSGMSAWKYRVGAGSVQTGAQTTEPSISWEQDANGWRLKNTDGSYLSNVWHQDTDGKWYYMGTDGYMMTNTMTPDGYKVGADGVWIQ